MGWYFSVGLSGLKSGGREKLCPPLLDRRVLRERESAMATTLVKVVSHDHSLGMGGDGRCGGEGGAVKMTCRPSPTVRAVSSWR